MKIQILLTKLLSGTIKLPEFGRLLAEVDDVDEPLTAPQYKGYTALDVAVIKNMLPLVKLLLDANANPAGSRSITLIYAVCRDSPLVLELLCRKADTRLFWYEASINELNAIPQLEDQRGFKVGLIFDSGLKSKEKKKKDMTALLLSTGYNKIECVNVLLTWLPTFNDTVHFKGYIRINLMRLLQIKGVEEKLSLVYPIILEQFLNSTDDLVDVFTWISVTRNSQLLVAIIQRMKALGIDINHLHERVFTPEIGTMNLLSYVIFFRPPTEVSLLLDNGADPTVFNSRGLAAVHLAVVFSKPAVLRTLLQSGKVDPNQQRNDARRQTALHLAIEVNSVEMLKILLAHGADPNIADSDGFNAIVWAFESGNQALIDALNVTHAEIASSKLETRLLIGGQEVKTASQVRPIFRAVAANSVEQLTYLHAKGESIDFCEGDVFPPLSVALNNLSLVQQFIALGANVHFRYKGDRSIHMAIKKFASIEVYALLKDNGVNLGFVDGDTHSPLVCAVLAQKL